MSQNHLIGNVSLDFRASRQTDGVALQAEVSDWFWQDVVPELNRALDEVVPPDVVLRLDRIAIELPTVGGLNWKEKLTTSVCRMVAEEIIRRRLFPRSTDAPVEEVSPTANSFDTWLDFIRTGQRRLSVAEPTDGQSIALSIIATSPVALLAFRQLLRTQSTALERLVRQHDDVFLVQLAEAMTGNSAHELLRWQSAFRGLFTATWWQDLLGNTSITTEQIEVVFWMMIFEKLSTDTYQSTNYQWIVRPEFFHKLFERISQRSVSTTYLALAITRFCEQKYHQIIYQKSRSKKPERSKLATSVFSEPQLQKAVQEALHNVAEGELLVPVFDQILREHSTSIAAFLKEQNSITDAVLDKNQSENAETNVAPGEQHLDDISDEVAEGEVFYVQNAGIVLLHPFLSAFFSEVGLQSSKKSDRRRAVQLIHYLATGDTKTQEYDLLLPKVLAGWPINQPIDRAIRLTKTEKAEAQNLLEMVIAYWSALGSTSVDGLREGFFHRDGRLSKRGNGWLLQVEKQTIDILLDQLPWGIGVIKHNWMNEFLYVEWF